MFHFRLVTRQFATCQTLLARQTKSQVKIPSKKALAAKARKKASKAQKNIYDSERMTLLDAIAVLRVCLFHCCLFGSSRMLSLMSPTGRRSCIPKFYVRTRREDRDENWRCNTQGPYHPSKRSQAQDRRSDTCVRRGKTG
jgi:hypothetical protein